MGLIILSDKNVKAKGLSNNDNINQEKLKEHFFLEDWEKLNLLNKIEKFEFNEVIPTLFYPGCGADILFPLHYLEKIANLKEVKFVFVDKDDSFGIIKTILDDVGVGFSEKEDKINFYWKGILVELEFIENNVVNLFGKITYDIYFEKAFRIMKEHIKDYESKIVEGLNEGGFLISDSGFNNTNLTNIEVPKELSSYNEMVILRKVSTAQ